TVRQPWDAEFHDSQAPAGEFWTWTIGGESARIEYYVPAAAAAATAPASSREIPFTVDRLQHVYRDPVAALYGESKSKAAGPCHNDVSCYPEWAALARAVAGIAVVDTDFLFCSGQLLNSQKADFTPYWLTANHCLSTAESAQLAEIFW